MSQCKDEEQFTCESGKMCIKVSNKCDEELDCHDGSDEKNCPWVGKSKIGRVRYGFSIGGNGKLT